MIPFLPRARVFMEAIGPADADQMAEIHGDAFARGWNSYELAQLVAASNVFAIGVRHESAFRGRRLVGFVLVRSAAGEAEILTIAVRQSSRGRGFGRQLMEEALRRLYHDRVGACFLEVGGENEAAVKLYRSLGFVTVGERKGYYAGAAGNGAALVMRLELGRRPTQGTKG
jgi:[ribosomal protein S18]-alanine N-acetyltransferase